MEGTLIPNYHYIEVKPDFSDLEERLTYYIEHPDEAEAIIQHAHDYTSQFRDEKREKLISVLVLKKYFDITNAAL
jgi:spore maturation protein CgeB